MTRLIVSIAFAAAVLPFTSAPAQDAKVYKTAYVNMQTVFEGYYKTVQANIRFANEKREFLESLKNKQEMLKSLSVKAKKLEAKLKDDLAKPRPEGEMAPFLGNSGRSSEGLVDWNWPRLGDRKYCRLNYGNFSGTLVSWASDIACRMNYDRKLYVRAMENIGKVAEKAAGKDLWHAELPSGYQVTSLVICGDAVVAGGGIYSTEPDVKAKGFVHVMSRDKGEKRAEHVFDSPVVYGGVAVLEKRICAALTDSSVCMLGE